MDKTNPRGLNNSIRMVSGFCTALKCSQSETRVGNSATVSEGVSETSSALPHGRAAARLSNEVLKQHSPPNHGDERHHADKNVITITMSASVIGKLAS